MSSRPRIENARRSEFLVKYWCARLVLSLPLRCQEPRGSQK